MAKKNNTKEAIATLDATEGAMQAGLGNCTAAKSLSQRSLGAVPDGRNRNLAALALAACGDALRSETLVEEAVKSRPEDTEIQKVIYPLVHALNQLGKGNGAGAGAALEPARDYERAGAWSPFPSYWVIYIRGRAYLQMKDADKAMGEFQKVLEHPGWRPASEVRPLAQLEMARGLAMKGDTAKAKTGYQDFLAMWKDAEADEPVFVEAKAEYGKLK